MGTSLSSRFTFGSTPTEQTSSNIQQVQDRLKIENSPDESIQQEENMIIEDINFKKEPHEEKMITDLSCEKNQEEHGEIQPKRLTYNSNDEDHDSISGTNSSNMEENNGNVRRSRRRTKGIPPRPLSPEISEVTPRKRKRTPRTTGKSTPKKSPRPVKHKVGKSKPIAPKQTMYTENAYYSINELIFAWDRGVLYESKVLKSDSTDVENPQYYVHYVGYSKNQNRWLTRVDMIKRDGKSCKYFEKLRGKRANFERCY